MALTCPGTYGEWCRACPRQNLHLWKLQAPNPAFDTSLPASTRPAVLVVKPPVSVHTLERAESIAADMRSSTGADWRPTPL